MIAHIRVNTFNSNPFETSGGMDSMFIFLDRIYRINEIFSACGERPFGRRPFCPDDPADPVQLLFNDKNPFLFFAVLRY